MHMVETEVFRSCPWQQQHVCNAVLAAEAFFRPASRSGAAFDHPPSHAQMRLGTAIGPSAGQMRLGTAVAPSYAQMRLGTAIAPGTARLGTASSGDSGARPMTSNKVRL